MRLAVAGFLLALMPAAAVAAERAPTDLTPDGPANLTPRFTGASPAICGGPRVLTGWRATVGSGGRSGQVRVIALGADGPVVGESVTLPAEPGTYTFPAPHVHSGCGGFGLGLAQSAGGHAVVWREACDPALAPWANACDAWHVDIDRDGQLRETWDGAGLALAAVDEPDIDADLRGDRTEDRTDLSLSTRATWAPDGKVRIALTVSNAGPLTADLPYLASERLDRAPAASWPLPCPATYQALLAAARGGHNACLLPPLSPGGQQTVTLDLPPGGTFPVSVGSEGDDLAPDDNSAEVPLVPPGYRVLYRKVSLAARRIVVRVRADLPGGARIVARAPGVRVSRTVRLRAGTQRLSLRLGPVNTRRLHAPSRRRALKVTVTARR